MQDCPADLAKLRERIAEMRDLSRIQSIVHWDMHTYMPSRGAEARKEQLATLSSLIHEKLTDPALGRLIQRLEPLMNNAREDSEETAVVREVAREHQRATRIPGRLMQEATRASSDGLQAWLRARGEEDFHLFLPALERNYDVSRRTAEVINPDSHPLDVMLDRREPGFTCADVQEIFSDLKETLVPLIARISDKSGQVKDSILHQIYDPARQWDLSMEAVRALGFDLDSRGRQDRSVHPFTTAFSTDDVRITTRIRDDQFSPCFFASLHEAGHGTYEQGLPARWNRCILGSAASGGMHESQSRLWENIVGRSKEFWQFFYPRVRSYFPEQTAGAQYTDFWKAVNRVQPSLIRVEADEVTYNLHIMIRFELEQAVYDGKLELRDLPAAWNEKFEEYLGIQPEAPSEGILQDIHWSGGFGASFVSYTLGNVISAQLFETAESAIPDLRERFRTGNFSALLTWMQENVHTYGKTLSPGDLVRQATGRDLSTRPYLRYIKSKTADLYDL